MTLSGRLEYILFRIAYIFNSIDKSNTTHNMQKTKQNVNYKTIILGLGSMVLAFSYPFIRLVVAE